MDAVWRYFDDAGRALRHGRGRCTTAAPSAERVAAAARARRAARSPRCVYPHKPDMADVAQRVGARASPRRRPDCVHERRRSSPSRRPRRYVRAALEAGTGVFKVHVQVGGVRPARRRCSTRSGDCSPRPASPVVVHCGSGPMPGRAHRPRPVRRGAAPRTRALTAVDRALRRAGVRRAPRRWLERYPNVHLDTTMVGTPFMNRLAPLPRRTDRRGYGDLQDRVVLGTDFPNIPYPYADAARRARAVRPRRRLAARGVLAQRRAPARHALTRRTLGGVVELDVVLVVVLIVLVGGVPRHAPARPVRPSASSPSAAAHTSELRARVAAARPGTRRRPAADAPATPRCAPPATCCARRRRVS